MYMHHIRSDGRRVICRVLFTSMAARSAAICVWLIASMPVYGQGFAWEMETGIADSSARFDTTRVRYMPGMFRIAPVKSEQVFIVRLDHPSIIVVNPRQKSYAQLGFTEWTRLTGPPDAQMFALPPHAQIIPQEERQRLLLRGPAVERGEVTVVRTGGSDVVGGYPCGRYEVRQGGKGVATVWTTIGMPGTDRLQLEMRDVVRLMVGTVPGMSSSVAEALKKIEGFPMRIRSGEMETTVTKLHRGAFAAVDFEPPLGYRKTTPSISQSR